MANDPVVIVSAARTPMGAFQGELKSFAAPQLGAAAIRAAVERANIKPEDVQEVIMGCVLPAGQGQAPARAAKAGSQDSPEPRANSTKMIGSGRNSSARPNSATAIRTDNPKSRPTALRSITVLA